MSLVPALRSQSLKPDYEPGIEFWFWGVLLSHVI